MLKTLLLLTLATLTSISAADNIGTVAPSKPGEVPTPPGKDYALYKVKGYHPAAEASAKMLEKYQSEFKITPRIQAEIQRVCPKFKNFDDVKKRQFWQLLVTATAYTESLFQPALVSRGPGRPSFGFFGFPVLKEDELPQYKNIASECHFKDLKAAEDAGVQMDCFGKYLSFKTKRAGCLFCRTGRYPQGLENAGAIKKVISLIKEHEPCD